jgi:hypothetical protein
MVYRVRGLNYLPNNVRKMQTEYLDNFPFLCYYRKKASRNNYHLNTLTIYRFTLRKRSTYRSSIVYGYLVSSNIDTDLVYQPTD